MRIPVYMIDGVHVYGLLALLYYSTVTDIALRYLGDNQFRILSV